MKNIKESIENALALQQLASKRGYELMEAQGCKWIMYTTPDNYEIEEDGITMLFREDTRHDCPDTQSVYLTVEHLEMDDKEWETYINQIIEARKKREKRQKIKDEEEKIEAKKRKYFELKKELEL